MDRPVSINHLPSPRAGTSHLVIVGRKGSAAEPLAAWARKAGVAPIDQVWVTAAPGLGIDQVRTFIRDLLLKPVAGALRLGILPEAWLLTDDAAHALLKIVEEPPPHAMILLGAEQEDQLLPTIVSRCQRWRLRFPDSDLRTPTTGGLANVEQIRLMSYRERLKLAESWAKEEGWKKHLERMMIGARALLHAGQLSEQAAADLVSLEQMAATNVTPRLLIENFLLACGPEPAPRPVGRPQ